MGRSRDDSDAVYDIGLRNTHSHLRNDQVWLGCGRGRATTGLTFFSERLVWRCWVSR